MLQGLKGNKATVYTEIQYIISFYNTFLSKIKSLIVAYWSFYVKTLHFAQINNTDNKNSNNVTETCHAHYFPSKDTRMGHKVVAYHLNRNIDSTHPTLWGFFL